jgi:LysM repeat protein
MDAVKQIGRGICLAIALLLVIPLSAAAQEPEPTATTPAEPRLLTADELLAMVNRGRQQMGHPALILDPILMSYIQGEADLAANDIRSEGPGALSSVIAMGYGYPETADTIFCTSNMAILEFNNSNAAIPTGFGTMDERAVNNVYYRHIGFGISKGSGDWEGYVFYLLLACYGADNRYTPGAPVATGSTTPAAVSQVIIPVRTLAPLPNGQIIHEVLSGQTLWAIAVAYHTHIQDILRINSLPPDTDIVYQGQKLLIPTPPGGGAARKTVPVVTLRIATLSPSAPVAEPTHMEARATPTPESSKSPTTDEKQLPVSNETLIVGVLLAGCLAFVVVTIFKR